MAAQNLEEAIQKAMSFGLANTFMDRMKYELRDYFAHRAMIVGGENASALDLFNDVFKDIPAIKGGSYDSNVGTFKKGS